MTRLASTLKREYEQAIRRIDIDEVPVQQFAQEAGITANNASVRVFRAREALRNQVKTSSAWFYSTAHLTMIGQHLDS